MPHNASEIVVLDINNVKCKNNALATINNICTHLYKFLHCYGSRILDSSSGASNYQGSHCKHNCWNNDCTLAKSRVSYWPNICTSFDRHRRCNVYWSHKMENKCLRKLSKEEIDSKT